MTNLLQCYYLFFARARAQALTLSPWALTMVLAWKASASAHPWLAAVLLGIANTSAGWIAHDYIHGK